MVKAIHALGDAHFINTFEGGFSPLAPTIASLKGGPSVVTWAKDSQIFHQRLNPDGSFIGEAVLTNTFTSISSWAPDVAGLEGGGYIITWQDNEQDGNGYGVYAQLYNSDGDAVEGEFRINTTTHGLQFEPSVTALSGGGFVVTWRSINTSTGDSDIYGKRFGADGSDQSGEFRVNTHQPGDMSEPAVVGLAGGGFIVTWQSYRQAGVANEEADIYAQQYSASGLPNGTEFLVNSNIDGYQIQPTATGLSDGGYIIIWGRVGTSANIGGQRYDADGNKVGGEFKLDPFNDGFGGTSPRPSIESLPDGGFIAVWNSFGQRFDANSEKVGGIVEIGHIASSLDVTVLKDGSFYVAWNDAGDLTGQHFDSRTFGTADDNTLTDTLGANWLAGLAGDDIVKGLAGRDYLAGNAGDDILFGNGGNDRLFGGGGSDEVSGGNGRDRLFGNKGHDTLDGGAGADTLNGGKGRDTLTGGANADVFLFDNSLNEHRDRILDFADGEDLIRISGGGFSDVTVTGLNGGANTKIALSGGTVIILEDVNKASITVDDFEFI